MRLKDQIAIVTGASKGIGKAIADIFVKEGAKVISFDMSKNDIGDSAGTEVEFVKGSVANREEVKNLYNVVIKKYGRIDILVNNAGITRDALIENTTEIMWDDVIDVNLKGVYNVTQLIGPKMMEQGVGTIINISSAVGEHGNIGQTNYSATKAGVIGLTKTWAKEFSRKGAEVRVNAIAPGYINTEMMKTVPQHVIEPIIDKTMLKKLGEPEDIANAALFLASKESKFITGHVLSVNGGLVF